MINLKHLENFYSDIDLQIKNVAHMVEDEFNYNVITYEITFFNFLDDGYENVFSGEKFLSDLTLTNEFKVKATENIKKSLDKSIKEAKEMVGI